MGFRNSSNAPTEEAALAIPVEIPQPDNSTIDKTIVWFHDESCFHPNKDQQIQWGDDTMQTIKAKSRV